MMCMSSISIHFSASNKCKSVQWYIYEDILKHPPPTSVLELHPSSMSIMYLLELLHVAVNKLINADMLEPARCLLDLVLILLPFSKPSPLHLLLKCPHATSVRSKA